MANLRLPWYMLVLLTPVDDDGPVCYHGWHIVNETSIIGGFTTACGKSFPKNFAIGERSATPEAINSRDIVVCSKCLANTLLDPRTFQYGLDGTPVGCGWPCLCV